MILLIYFIDYIVFKATCIHEASLLPATDNVDNLQLLAAISIAPPYQ